MNGPSNGVRPRRFRALPTHDFEEHLVVARRPSRTNPNGGNDCDALARHGRCPSSRKPRQRRPQKQ